MRIKISGLYLEAAGALLQLLLHLGDPYLTINYGRGSGLLRFLRAY